MTRQTTRFRHSALAGLLLGCTLMGSPVQASEPTAALPGFVLIPVADEHRTHPLETTIAQLEEGSGTDDAVIQERDETLE